MTETRGNKMEKVVKWGPYISLVLMCVALVIHLSGICSGHWLYAEASSTYEGDIRKVIVGLTEQMIEYKNDTKNRELSSLTLQTEQYVVLAISCINTALCAVIIVKPVAVIVGISGFLGNTMMLVATITAYNNIELNLEKVQTGKLDWPPLRVGYSFDLVLVGILLNTLMSMTFLILQLIKVEIEAEAQRHKSDTSLTKIRLSLSGISSVGKRQALGF